jgi:hypothetical protein
MRAYNRDLPRWLAPKVARWFVRSCQAALIVCAVIGLAHPKLAGASDGGVIGDFVWHDLNFNGLQDTGEPGLAGVTVRLYRYLPNATPQSTITDANGYFHFSNLSYSGAYQLEVVKPPHYDFSPQYPNDDYQKDSDIDPVSGRSGAIFPFGQWALWHDAGMRDMTTPSQFGNCRSLLSGTGMTLGDTIFDDVNGDGHQQSFEPGLGGVLVALHQQTGIGLARTEFDTGLRATTNSSGTYQFTCLPPGEYNIVVENFGRYQVSKRPVPIPDPDTTVESDNNCKLDPMSPGGPAVRSEAILLQPGTEPEGNMNRTLDCGFTCKDTPVSVALAIDTSSSTASRLQDAKDAALVFAEDFMSNDPQNTSHRAAVVHFDDYASPKRALTHEKWRVVSAIQALATGGQDHPQGLTNTRIDLGLEEAQQELVTPSDIQVIILISDGYPTGGGFTPEQLRARVVSRADAIKAAGIRLVTIGFGNSIDHGFLRQLASSPRDYYSSPSGEQLKAVYASLAATLCNPHGGAGTILECSGDSSYRFDLSTGASAWQVSEPGSSSAGPVQVVSPVPSAWPQAWEGSSWVSLQASASSPQTGTYTYQMSFPLPEMPGAVDLVLHAWADDRILRVLVNDSPVAIIGDGSFNGAPIRVAVNDPSLFIEGNNTIKVEVEDDGGLTGLNLVGEIVACAEAKFPSNAAAPSILQVNVESPKAPGTVPTTGFDVVETPVFYIPRGFALTGCEFIGLSRQYPTVNLSNPCVHSSFVPVSDQNAASGSTDQTYGRKKAQLAAHFAGPANARITLVHDYSYDVFFETFADDDRDGTRNWFEYWRVDKPIAGLDASNVLYAALGPDGASGWFDPGDRTITLLDKSLTLPGFTIPLTTGLPLLYCPPLSIDTYIGVRATAAVLEHELYHLRSMWQFWQPGGQWSGWVDSDAQPGYRDFLPDIEEQAIGLDITNVDSCHLGQTLNRKYAYNGDNEYMAFREMTGTADVSKDWSSPGIRTLERTGLPLPPPHLRSQPWNPTSEFPEPESEDRFGGETSASLLDEDADGQAEGLQLAFNIDVLDASETGGYSARAWLADSAGNPMLVASSESIVDVPITGTHALTVTFDGPQLNDIGASGPYRVKAVQVVRSGAGALDGEVFAAARDVFTTTNHAAGDFEPPAARFMGSAADQTVDTDLDGLADRLDVGLPLEVAVPGNYTLSAELVVDGQSVAAESITATLAAGMQLVALPFDGSEIFRARRDGAFGLRVLRIESADRQVLDLVPELDFATSYTHQQFEHGPATIGNLISDRGMRMTPTGTLLPGPGPYDMLQVSLGLVAPTPVAPTPGDGYHVMGQLIALDGTRIATAWKDVTGSPTNVNSGVTLEFSGADIAASGVNGPYRVVVALYDAQDNLADAVTEGFRTQMYLADDFRDPTHVP